MIKKDGRLFEIYLLSKTLSMRPKEVLELTVAEKELIINSMLYERGNIDEEALIEYNDEELEELKKRLLEENN